MQCKTELRQMDIDSTRNMYLKKGLQSRPNKKLSPSCHAIASASACTGPVGGGQIVQGGPGKSKVTLAVVFAWAGLGLELWAWAAAVCECVSE
ncbi:hypothetical protein M431DRAFT_508734 [Trichoderma harzianum CBS 226.95]|uniref:Uncharacterized protein n=1 Tax=Trichoderma harzianum CBS 226.95 TaxID=983964 RepID=A0A2T4A992_TRIHA|nr:hypothetical protein M431DRAFT_508734 [Trichoderma harzianum CBS 226.95]PTB53637.1 hypothetical protein M431DRAFT_508734 [Trichoderma harzianum CBS 226.95]